MIPPLNVEVWDKDGSLADGFSSDIFWVQSKLISRIRTICSKEKSWMSN